MTDQEVEAEVLRILEKRADVLKPRHCMQIDAFWLPSDINRTQLKQALKSLKIQGKAEYIDPYGWRLKTTIPPVKRDNP